MGTNDVLVLETGFRHALCRLTVSLKDELKSVLRDYNSVIKSKAELDQYCEGLKTMSVFESIQGHPSLMSPFFIPQSSNLCKGKRKVHNNIQYMQNKS